MDGPYRIRPAVLADAPALVAIERRSFGDPWSEASFREALDSAWTFVLVAETARGVGGYSIGREAGGAGEVLNLAVAPEFRRRGVGEALLEAGLVGVSAAAGWRRCFSRCASRTPRRSALYARHGFRPVGQRSAYYRNPKEDALVLRLELSQPA